jgi:pimeloyl-ACP methyl ester carboxylesterase
VYGKRSSARPVGARLARVLPDVRLVELEGGHFLHLDAPDELGRHVTEFVRG